MPGLAITVFDVETGSTSEYRFENSPVRIGRNPLNDLPLPFAFVSGWHAVVRFDETGARFFDLGSTNGTLLDGRRVQAGEPVEIAGVLSVTIGKLELQMRSATFTGTRSPMPQHDPSGMGTGAPIAPTAAWQVVTGDRSGSQPIPMSMIAAAAGAPSVAPTGVHPIAGGASPGTAHVPMHVIHEAVSGLRGHVDAYRRSWSSLRFALEQTLAPMDAATRTFALTFLGREHPELAHEPEFVAMLAAVGVAPSAAPTAGSGDRAAELVAKLSRALRPGDDPPRTADEMSRFLGCVEDVLRASAKAFVELQKGQEQFGSEMGVRTIKEFTPLHAAGTAENVLRYLLDYKAAGHRTKELVGIYADLMIHQVALINGVLEGARGLLTRLDPGEIERSVTTPWPGRGAALWKQFTQRHKELLESDRRLTEAIFGPEFARAYAEVGGGQ
jgi:type VI secretion system protein